MRETTRTAILLVTHNIGVVAQLCDQVGVMYAGRLVEWGTVREVLESPAHPYTQALLRSIPDMQGGTGRDPGYAAGFYRGNPRVCVRSPLPSGLRDLPDHVAGDVHGFTRALGIVSVWEGRGSMMLLEVEGLEKSFIKDSGAIFCGWME